MNLKIPESIKKQPIVKYDASNGRMIERYEDLGEMAQKLDIATSTAYYRVKSVKPFDGILFDTEEDYKKRFPVRARALKKTEAGAKAEVVEIKADAKINEQISEQADKRTSEQADKVPDKITDKISDEINEQADMVNHPPHYCTGDIECWDAMVSAFGREWMKAYATVTAFKYIWRAKHKGRFAEDMKKAAWYESKAAELEGVING